MGKSVKKPTIRKKGNSYTISIPVDYGAAGNHQDYSGYGVHGKDRRAHRRDRTMEEKRVRRGDWD